MKKAKKTFLYILGILLVALQAVVSGIVIYEVVRLNMVPLLYLAIGIVVLVLLEVLTVYLFFRMPGEKKDKKSGRRISRRWRQKRRRTIAIAVALVVTVVCGILASALNLANTTVKKVTGQEQQGTVIGVYVMTDSKAETIRDIADKIWGRTDSYDAENSNAAIENINTVLGQEINAKNYDSVNAMADALYSGEVEAMVLNEAYPTILEDQEAFSDFADQTRLIYEYKVETKIDTKDKGQTKSDVETSKDPFVIYISGSDTRSQTLVTSRSDVNLLAVVNPSTKQILLVNTPRDYYVPTSVSHGARDKLTHAGIYGVQCSMDTLGMLYDTNVDYYAQINFTGFETLINAIDGVSVNVDQAVKIGNYSFSVGMNEMNGEQALAYVRERHAFADGDNARGRHQMAVLTAVINKLTSATTILTNYADVMNSMQGMFATDLSGDDIGGLVKMQLSDGTGWNVRSYAVTGTGDSNVTYSTPGQNLYVMVPNQTTVDHAKDLINKVKAGDTLSDEDLQAD